MKKLILILTIFLYSLAHGQQDDQYKSMDKIDNKYYTAAIEAEKNKEIKKLKNTIRIFRAKVDSLELIILESEPEYVFVTLIKDIETRVDVEFQSTYSKAKQINIVNGKGELGIPGLTNVYIVDTLGRTYKAVWDDNYIYVDDLQESFYFVVAVDSSGKIFTFKFVI